MTDLPRQNRVDPFGELVSTPERGTLFGNRGVLHDEDGRIIRRHQLKRWIYCRLEYKGWRRQLMQPGDEAPFLWRGNELLRWSFAGYGAPRAAVREEVAVLTPPSTVKAIAAGFEPYFGA
jgi:hypothetical protein